MATIAQELRDLRPRTTPREHSFWFRLRALMVRLLEESVM